MTLNLNEAIHFLTPTTSHNLQSSVSNANTPDVTPKTRTLLYKVIDCSSTIEPGIKPKKLFFITSSYTNVLKKLKKLVTQQKKLLMSKRVKISKVKKNLIASKMQNRRNKFINFMNLLKFSSQGSKKFVEMQISRHNISTKL